MKCYGRWYGRLQTCGSCRYRRFCAEAGDPPLILRERSVRADTVDDLPDPAPPPRGGARRTARCSLPRCCPARG